MMLLSKFFPRSSGQLTAAQILDYQTRIAACEAQVAQLETMDATGSEIAAMRDELQTLQARALVQKGQVMVLQTKLESVSRLGNDVIASQGLAADCVPMAMAHAFGTESAWQKYHSLLASNPQKAGEYYASNANEILASKPKGS